MLHPLASDVLTKERYIRELKKILTVRQFIDGISHNETKSVGSQFECVSSYCKRETESNGLPACYFGAVRSMTHVGTQSANSNASNGTIGVVNLEG